MANNHYDLSSIYTAADKYTVLQLLNALLDKVKDLEIIDVDVNKTAVNKFKLVFTFADNTTMETPEFALEYDIVDVEIVNGHLIFTFDGDNTYDAGNLKGVTNFAINSSQHLIVNYQDGTSQDLGAIFNGNINIVGTITSTGNISAPNTNEVIGIVKGTSLPSNYYREGDITLNTNTQFAQEGGQMPYGHWRVSNGKLNVVLCLSVPANTTITAKQTRNALSDAFNIPAEVAQLLTDIPGAAGYKAIDMKPMIGTNAYGQTGGSNMEIWLLIDAAGHCRIDYGHGQLFNQYVALFSRFEFNFIL